MTDIIKTVESDLKRHYCARLWVLILIVLVVVVLFYFRSALMTLVGNHKGASAVIVVVAAVVLFMMFKHNKCLDNCNNSPNLEEVLECRKNCTYM